MRKTAPCLHLLLAVLLLASAGSSALAVADNFNDNTILSQLWSPAMGGGATVAEVNNRLELTIPGNAVGSYFFAGYDCRSQFVGNFDIQVDYSLLTWPPGNSVRMGIRAYTAGTPYANMLRIANSVREPGGAQELYLADMYNAPSPSPRTSTTQMSGKLRLRRSGAYVTGSYFNSGSWTDLCTSYVSTANMGFSLYAWSGSSIWPGNTVKVAYDNFIVNSGTLVPEVPEPSSLLAVVSIMAPLGVVLRRKKK